MRRKDMLLNDQPALGRRVCRVSLEVRHLSVTEVRGLRQIVQAERTADAGALAFLFVLSWALDSGCNRVTALTSAKWQGLAAGRRQTSLAALIKFL